MDLLVMGNVTPLRIAFQILSPHPRTPSYSYFSSSMTTHSDHTRQHFFIGGKRKQTDMVVKSAIKDNAKKAPHQRNGAISAGGWRSRELLIGGSGGQHFFMAWVGCLSPASDLILIPNKKPSMILQASCHCIRNAPSCTMH